MTEEELKTKRCPKGVGQMFRIDDGLEGHKYAGLNVYASTCIGSDCAWYRERSDGTKIRVRGIKEDGTVIEGDGWKAVPVHAYCGGAGR